jgi:hypothetical protein
MIKNFLIKVVFWVIDLIFKIKLYRAMKEKEFDNLFNGNGNGEIEEITIEPSEKAEPASEPAELESEPEPARRGRRKTELRAHAGKVYRVEIETGLVQEIDGKKIPKAERRHFSDYVSGNFEQKEQKVESEGKPLNIPADLILNFAIVPLNNHIAEKTKDELKLKIGNGLNPEREKAAADLAELLSKYIAEKTRVANPNEVILATSAILFAAPLAVSYSTNKKEDA